MVWGSILKGVMKGAQAVGKASQTPAGKAITSVAGKKGGSAVSAVAPLLKSFTVPNNSPFNFDKVCKQADKRDEQLSKKNK